MYNFQAKEILKKQIGDIFDIVESQHCLWHSKNNVLFIKLKRHKQGFIDKLKQSNFIKSAEEAGGNNIIKVVIKNIDSK